MNNNTTTSLPKGFSGLLDGVQWRRGSHCVGEELPREPHLCSSLEYNDLSLTLHFSVWGVEISLFHSPPLFHSLTGLHSTWIHTHFPSLSLSHSLSFSFSHPLWHVLPESVPLKKELLFYLALTPTTCMTDTRDVLIHFCLFPRIVASKLPYSLRSPQADKNLDVCLCKESSSRIGKYTSVMEGIPELTISHW